MISHLGRNPVSGGRPPVDNKIIDRVGSSVGILLHSRDMEVIEVVVYRLMIMNIGTVSRI